MDFIFDRTTNGLPLKVLSVIDDYTRECIALQVGRKLTGNGVVDVLAGLLATRGKPGYIRAGNGPEFICERLRRFLRQVEIGTSYVETGSPWENGYVGSLHSRLRDECLGCEIFQSVAEARSVIEGGVRIASTGGRTAAFVACPRRSSRRSVLLPVGQRPHSSSTLRNLFHNPCFHNPGPRFRGAPWA